MPEDAADTSAEGSRAQHDTRSHSVNSPGVLQGIWKFLNSAFCLFLLSTVAITWATKLSTGYQAREQLRSERRLRQSGFHRSRFQKAIVAPLSVCSLRTSL